MHIDVIFPTSILVERFSSKENIAYEDRRHGLIPIHLYPQTFLTVNLFWIIEKQNNVVKYEKSRN